MSEHGGCLVCGATLGLKESLMCGDCRAEGSMQQTGTRAQYVRLTDTGPQDASEEVARLQALARLAERLAGATLGKKPELFRESIAAEIAGAKARGSGRG